MRAKQSGNWIIFQMLASWFFRNKTVYACKHGWRIAKHFPILSPFYNSSGPVECSDPSSRALPFSQRRHVESIGHDWIPIYYGQPAILLYQVLMPHVSPSTSSVPSSESETLVASSERTPLSQKYSENHYSWTKKEMLWSEFEPSYSTRITNNLYKGFHKGH